MCTVTRVRLLEDGQWSREDWTALSILIVAGVTNLNGEFWLGLDKINRLTCRTKNRLRVDLEFNSNNIIRYPYAEYDLFGVK